MILHISVISRTIARTMVLSDNGGGGNGLHPCRRAAGLWPAVGQAAHMSEFQEFMARSWHGHAAGLRHHGGCQHPPRAEATRSSSGGARQCPRLFGQLRGALRRSRRHKKTFRSLSKGGRPAAQGPARVRVPERSAGGQAGHASREQGDAVEGALQPQERAAAEAALRAQAGPTAGHRRPWPHPTACARGENRTARPAGG